MLFEKIFWLSKTATMIRWLQLFFNYLMSRFEGFFQRLKASQQLFVEYWKKSPTTKIIVINTGIYVSRSWCSASGSSKSFLKTLWSNTFLARGSTHSQEDFILSLRTLSHTWAFLVSVFLLTFSVRLTHVRTHGKSTSKSRRK